MSQPSSSPHPRASCMGTAQVLRGRDQREVVMCLSARALSSRSGCSECDRGVGGVDDELLVGFGVGGECVPVERELADDWMLVPARTPSFDGDVCAGPLLAELAVADCQVADEFGEA